MTTPERVAKNGAAFEACRDKLLETEAAMRDVVHELRHRTAERDRLAAFISESVDQWFDEAVPRRLGPGPWFARCTSDASICEARAAIEPILAARRERG